MSWRREYDETLKCKFGLGRTNQPWAVVLLFRAAHTFYVRYLFQSSVQFFFFFFIYLLRFHSSRRFSILLISLFYSAQFFFSPSRIAVVLLHSRWRAIFFILLSDCKCISLAQQLLCDQIKMKPKEKKLWYSPNYEKYHILHDAQAKCKVKVEGPVCDHFHRSKKYERIKLKYFLR